MNRPGSTTRRGLLAGAGAAATAALAGCSEQLWSRADRSELEQVSLTVKTLPADDDQIAARIASHLTGNLQAAGIDSYHEPMSEHELYREVLIEGEYELFVGKHPGFDNLDALRSLLHSDFVSEPGWQNPFGFSNRRTDDLLEEQCEKRGYDRLATFSELFEHLLFTAPYTAVAFPTHVGVTTPGLEASTPPRRPHEFFELLTNASIPADRPLNVGLFEYALTDRLNPLFVGLDEARLVLELLYDPLVRLVDDEHVPWLAEDVSWESDDDVAATVTLREGTTWHDGTSLDADDVEFTVDFLRDTSLGAVESGVPAPQYRGRTTLVDEVTVEDDRTLRFRFGDHSEAVARRALTLPVFPEHVWTERTTPVGDYVTEALTQENVPPVGSGLFQFAERAEYEFVRLEPFPDHVLRDVDSDRLPPIPGGDDPDDGIRFQSIPNIGAALESLRDGDLDLVGSSLVPEDGPAVPESNDFVALEAQTRSFYIAGFNVRHPELGNPRFRRALSHMIDREWVVEEFFEGYADAATTQNGFAGVDSSAWEFPVSTDVPSFPGSNGEVDAEAARALFENAGYRYNDGELVS